MPARSYLLALPVLLLTTLPVLSAPPTQAEIDKAASELGDKRFAVREKASKLLWEAGVAAEPALRKALQSGDAETVRRAQGLLDKFEWGIYPDTPAEIVTLISQFKGGDQAQRIEVVSKLIVLGRGGFATLRRLANMTTSVEERKAVFDQMSVKAQQTVPTMILAGDLAFAEELLELCLAGESEQAPVNYAAFQHLRGKLDAALERWQKEFHDPKHDAKAGEVLIHLYRVKGDFAAAKKVAEQMENDTLLENVLWEDSDWKGLAKLIRKQGNGARDATTIGAHIGILKLAGDSDGLEKALHDLRNMVQTEDRYDWLYGIEALLLNGHATEAMELLLEKKRTPAITFDLLCAQLKFREAFELAHTAEKLEGEEGFTLKAHKARAMYLLGQREEALQLFTLVAAEERKLEGIQNTRELIKILQRLALEERADEVCAQYLNLLVKENRFDSWEQIVDPLFGKNSGLAIAWWRFLQERFTKEEPGSIMKKVRALLEGKPVADREDLCRKMAEWIAPIRQNEFAPQQEVPSVLVDPADAYSSKTVPLLCAAEAMRAAGQDEAAIEYFAKATKAGASFNAWIRYGDLLAGKMRFADATQQYAKAASRHPDQPLALFLQGWALIKAGKEEEGRRYQELAHWMPLGSEQVRFDFAEELERRHFTEAARQERDFVMKTGWYRYWYVSNLISESARQAAARKDFRVAAAFSQKSIIGCMRIGATYVENSAYLLVPQVPVHYHIRQLVAEDKLDEASKEIAACLDVLPGNVELAIGLVPQLEKKGRKSEADELYSKVIRPYEELSKQHPQSAYLHNDCAWLAANCRRDLEKALEHAKEAVKLEPKAAGYIDTLAEVHFRRGEKDKALEFMKQCIALKPRNPYYRKQLERFTKGDIATDPPPEVEDD
jgi:tetratricopeptide (TPR) repeat protein